MVKKFLCHYFYLFHLSRWCTKCANDLHVVARNACQLLCSFYISKLVYSGQIFYATNYFFSFFENGLLEKVLSPAHCYTRLVKGIL